MSDEEVYQRRTNAMRTLNLVYLSGFQRAKVKEALRVCRDCDFLEPRIARVVSDK